MGRIYSQIITLKLEEQVSNKNVEDQTGFTIGSSCVDHIYTVQQLREFCRSEIRKAYNLIPTVDCYEIMIILMTFIAVVKRMYEKNIVYTKFERN